MVLLLVSVLAHQYIRYMPVARPGAVWLAGDHLSGPNEPTAERSEVGLGL